jgi:glycogen debranching enzyme
MNVNYKIGEHTLKQRTNNHISFMLMDEVGGYFWKKQKEESRYQGWFINLNGRIFKILDSITRNYNNENVNFVDIYATGKQITLKKHDFEENICINNLNCFKYSLSRISNIHIFLDIRPINQFPTWNRTYNIYSKTNYLLIKYSYPKHEDIFVAISKKGLLGWSKLANWVEKKYSYDQNRNSSPNKLYVFQALKIKTKSLVLGVGLSEKEAFQNIKSAKKTVLFSNNEINNDSSIENYARCISQLSLKNFFVENKQLFGLYAGLPWFFQFWLRDEAISLKELYRIMPHETIKLSKARLKQIKSNNFPQNVIKSADGLLWYIYRFLEMNLLKFKNDDIEKIVSIAEKSYLKSDSWMDTLKRQDTLENYCLQLAIYHSAYRITKKDIFLNKENKLKKMTKSIFWKDNFLADTKEDKTIRPNIFLAYYIYPYLLKKEEWEICFDIAIKHLWCNWGGFSTVSQSNPQYYSKHTGENPQSYHNGDSWLWINNLAALSMIRLNKQKYYNKILQIKKTNLKDLLSCGILGFSSELSSANHFHSSGSPAQLWSSATLIEMLSSS